MVEWRTGRVISSVRTERNGHVVGLQSDGVALWSEGPPGYGLDSGPFSITVPGGDQRPIALPGGVLPRLAGGRVAYHDLRRGEVVVTDLQGRALAAAAVPPQATSADVPPIGVVDPRAPYPALADFDGQRAVWAYTPCAVSLVTVWDVDDAPPRQPGPRCPAARLAGAVTAVDYAIRIPLRCPKARLTGCPTKLTVRRGSTVSSTSAHLPPATRRSITVDTTRGRPRHLTVTTEPALRPARGERRTWRVRVGG